MNRFGGGRSHTQQIERMSYVWRRIVVLYHAGKEADVYYVVLLEVFGRNWLPCIHDVQLDIWWS